MNEKKNAKFGSRWGFILSAVGSAVGMANVWGFPAKMGANGGGAFLVAYLIFVALFSVVGLSAEYAIGRRSRTGTLGSYRAAWATRNKAMGRAGGLLGWLPLAGSMCIAIGFVLSCIKLYRMPQGGSITAASMLPIIIFAYAYGAGPGLTLGAVYGVLQFILKPYFYSLPQFLLDYPVAFGCLGLAGFFSKSKNTRLGLTLGAVAAAAGRLIAAVASGVLFFAEYAPEGMSPLAYSLGYNASYMVPECIICVALAVAVGPRLMKELRKIK